MALDPNYIVGINLGEVFVDKDTGLPLSGGKIYFYKDSARNVPKPVFQITGSPPNYTYSQLSNNITLSAVGTIQNDQGVNVAVYYYPFDSEGNVENYYIVVKSSSDVVQFEREAWPNVTPTSTPGGETTNTAQNEISNSQFVDVLFPTDTGLEISWTGVLSETAYQIAPDWNLFIEASGTGSVTITRNAIAGSLNVITNPPFSLEFVASSVNITKLKLVQRLYNNPDIWANQYLSGNMVVESLDGISRTFSILYSPSINVTPTTILTGSSGAVDPTQLFGSTLIPSGINSDDGNIGYVDIEIILPNAGNYSITSIQITSGDSELDDPEAIEYQEQPVNRQKDFSFHYYRPQILQLAVPSISQGWDFRVNPAQWGASGSLLAVRSQYIWDQTIGYQSIDNAITYQRASDGSLEIDVDSTCQLALIQYLTPSMFLQLLQSNFSTLLTALTDVSGGVSGTVSFWYTTDVNLPDVSDGSNQSIVATLDENGKPDTFNGNWVEITRSTGWDARFSILQGTTQYTSVPLEGWNVSDISISSIATYVAIVVGFSSTTPGAIKFQSISVTPTLIASPFAPLSYEATLHQMQPFYEQSYDPETAPGTATVNSCFSVAQQFIYYYNGDPDENDFDYFILSDSFNLVYKNIKIKTPNFYVFSVTGLADKIQLVGITTNDYNWDAYWFGSGSQNSIYSYLSVGQGGYIQAMVSTPGGVYHPYISFHYVADARLGIVL